MGATGSRGANSRAAGMLVAALSVASAATAVLLSRQVFPFLSINNDEAINRLFADTLAHGDLFPTTLGLPDAFRPWLAAASDGHYVLKYTPVVPGMIAASQLLTDGTALYLAAVAGGVVAMTYLLGLEVLQNRTEALVATVLIALSPLVLVQSALFLSYLPTLLLLEVFAWALLRGLSTSRDRLLAMSGLGLGLAFVARPYDAPVFAAPLLVWAVAVGLRRQGRIRSAAAFSVPGALALGAFLAFNQAATGNALRPPFSLLEGQDALGFGVRRLYPGDPPHSFGLMEGVTGVLRHAALLNLWVTGGSLLLVLAVVTLVRRRVQGPLWALSAAAVLLPLSHVFFWGPWNATVLWGGTTYLGPFYFLPVLIPVALLAARTLVDATRWRAGAGVAVSGVMVVVTAVALVPIVRGNLAFTQNSRALHRLVVGRAPAQLVLAAMPTPFLMHPPAVIANRSELDGPVVFAVERGEADLDAARLMAERRPYRLVVDGEYRDPDESFGARLEELRLTTAGQIELTVRVAPVPGAEAVSVVISALGRTREYALGGGGRAYEERVTVDATSARLTDRSPRDERPDPAPDGLEVTLVVRSGAGDQPVTAASARLPLRVAGPLVEALVPTGSAWTTGTMPAPLLELTA